tara:strand:- start:130 stop:534 length:405 start_codon:yes stop_codon:yes gene_type:complete
MKYTYLIIFILCQSFLFGQNVVQFDICTKANIRKIGDEWVTMKEQTFPSSYPLEIYFNNKTGHLAFGDNAPLKFNYIKTGTFSDGQTEYRKYVHEDNPDYYLRFQMKKKKKNQVAIIRLYNEYSGKGFLMWLCN